MDAERWRRVADLCHDAMARAAGERAAFVDEACAGDEALRAEVLSLLTFEGPAEHFLEHPASRPLSQVVAPDHLAGRTLGTYHLQGVIGAGGMADVYRARDAKLDRDVAVKILPPVFARDTDRLQRFQREARLLAALNHPNVLTIHDVGTADGIPFVVTELLEGQTLRALLDGPGVAAPVAIDLARQAALGLAAAHRKGIVHRDVKPENLFLTVEGGLKILDFGVAKVMPVRSSCARSSATWSPPTARARWRSARSCSRCSPSAGPPNRCSTR